MLKTESTSKAFINFFKYFLSTKECLDNFKKNIGDWGLGIGQLGPIPNPQSPIPNPQSPISYIYIKFFFILNLIISRLFKLSLRMYSFSLM